MNSNDVEAATAAETEANNKVEIENEDAKTVTTVTNTATQQTTPNIRRNERRSARSIYATPRGGGGETVVTTPTPTPTPTPKARQRVRKTDSQTSFDAASSSITSSSRAASSDLSMPNTPATPKSASNSGSLLKYKVGMLVEARDSAKEWYRARVVETDDSQQRVKVHFLGWNSRFDQWFEVKSSDIRLVKPKSGRQQNEEDETNNEIPLSKREFAPGSKIMAKWKDEFFYPAYIIREKDTSSDGTRYFEIRFTDKVRRVVKVDNLREPSEEELRYGFEPVATPKSGSTSSLTTAASTSQIEQVAEASSSQVKVDDGEQKTADISLPIAPISQAAPQESTTVTTATSGVETTPSDPNRKSLRVKRLRTYTEEIVFDSPAASIAYNLASVHKQTSLDASQTSASLAALNAAKKRKMSMPILPEEPSEAPNTNVERRRSSGSSKNSNVKNYFTSLKLFKSRASSKKLALVTGAKKVVKTKNVVEKKKESKKDKKKKEEEEVDKKLKKKKKLKRDKMKLFEQLIETSKKQLQHQQELIEKQLKQHEHKKSQKKMQKLLKRQLKEQRRQQEQQQQQFFSPSNSLFFPTACSNELILSQLLQMQMQSQAAAAAAAFAFPQTVGASNQLLLTSQQSRTSIQHQQSRSASFMEEEDPSSLRDRISSEPIPCTVENCSKTFRKQTLLDYHLKYHHHINPSASTSVETPSTPSIAAQSAKKRRLSSSVVGEKKRTASFLKLASSLGSGSTITPTTNRTLLMTNEDANVDVDGDDQASGGLATADEVFVADLLGLSDSSEGKGAVDPYEVIHCKCGSHSSVGFMIQCDTCLCWQHGECVGLKKGDAVPSNYSCWVCSEPENKLRALKYKNWSSARLEKEIMRRLEALEEGSQDHDDADDEYAKLCLLNDFSRRFYNLNLLVYTLEYQCSLFNRTVQTLNKIHAASAATNTATTSATASSNVEDELPPVAGIDCDEQTFDLVDKLAHNISHLKTCVARKFEQFNSKLDEFEAKYPQDANSSLMANLDLEKLYKQFQSSIKSKS